MIESVTTDEWHTELRYLRSDLRKPSRNAKWTWTCESEKVQTIEMDHWNDAASADKVSSSVKSDLKRSQAAADRLQYVQVC